MVWDSLKVSPLILGQNTVLATQKAKTHRQVISFINGFTILITHKLWNFTTALYALVRTLLVNYMVKNYLTDIEMTILFLRNKLWKDKEKLETNWVEAPAIPTWLLCFAHYPSAFSKCVLPLSPLPVPRYAKCTHEFCRPRIWQWS